jgi:hypothetical protein
MAMGDLERIEDYAEMISDRMKEGQELSAWMYSQITLAVDQLNAVHDTMDGKDGVKESVNEATYTDAPGAWVAFLSMMRGKKLLKTFDTARGAKQFLSKNVDKLLGGANVESVGIMTKKDWDQKEAKYAIESVNEEKPGLWANIRAKKARGEEPAHGNSDAHKDAVKAGKKINNEASTPGEQIQNLNNRLTKLRQDMAKAKSPEAKNVIQAKMKNALQKLSDKKKDMGIKKP